MVDGEGGGGDTGTESELHMINSTNPDRLRPDVAYNCKTILAACAAAGFKAGLSCTYRDQDYQTHLHNTVGAPALVSFHGAGLAFDIFENLNGKTSYRPEFFAFVAPLAKKMGFTWGGDWRSVDKPHFQWDNHGLINGSLVRQGMMPPNMARYATDKIADYKAVILKRMNLSDPERWWKRIDGDPFAEEFYKRWVESYK